MRLICGAKEALCKTSTKPFTTRDSIMADGQDCRGRVLIVGHSFVRRLGDFLDWKEVEV